MHSTFASSWTARLMGICLFANFLFFYYFYEASLKPYQAPERRPAPILESAPYIEVVTPEDSEIWPYRVFKSSPWTPINISISANTGGLADGYLFFTPKSRRGDHVKQTLGLILSQDNELVYAWNESFGINDFRVQNISGRPHATFWQGHSVLGHGYGEMVVLDDSYQRSSVELGSGIRMLLSSDIQAPGLLDFHEQEMTPWGSVLVTAYNNTPANLSAYGGPSEGWLADSLFYEIEVATQEVLFSWSALDHFTLEDSRLPLPSYMGDGTKDHPYDFFHINSMQSIGEDAFLINSRHMWACYLVSRKTGEVLWELNGSGEGGNFGPLPEEGQFRWQHHARAHNITEKGMSISFFDNHNTEEDTGKVQTRGLVINVELPPDSLKSPAVLRNLQPPEETFTQSQGSYEADLGNSNQLMGYGPIPVVREFGPSGDLRWEGRFDTTTKPKAIELLSTNGTRLLEIGIHRW